MAQHNPFQMASIIPLGTTFVIFFIVVGMLWLIGSYVIFSVIDEVPLPPEGPWRDLQERNIEQIEAIIMFLPPVLFVFAAIKVLTNATQRGAN